MALNHSNQNCIGLFSNAFGAEHRMRAGFLLVQPVDCFMYVKFKGLSPKAELLFVGSVGSQLPSNLTEYLAASDQTRAGLGVSTPLK